jgi:transposase
MKQDTRTLNQTELMVVKKLAMSLFFDQGHSKSFIAKSLNLSRVTLNKWCDCYLKNGEQGLRSGLRGRKKGESAQLSSKQQKEIAKIIEDKCPEQMKMPFVLWTALAVKELIQTKYSVDYSLEYVRRILREWGFTPQVPIRKSFEQSAKEVKHWITRNYPMIKKLSIKESSRIFWVDETGITNKCNNTRGYAKKGQTPVLKEVGKIIKRNMISAVSNKGEVLFECYQETMTQQLFIQFLDRLQKQAKQKVIVIVDNLKVHHGKIVKEWLEQNKHKISLYYIPSYSPELNPDEYLNRDLKKNVNLNRMPRTEEELEVNIDQFMKNLQQNPERCQKYFHSSKIQYAA